MRNNSLQMKRELFHVSMQKRKREHLFNQNRQSISAPIDIQKYVDKFDLHLLEMIEKSHSIQKLKWATIPNLQGETTLRILNQLVQKCDTFSFQFESSKYYDELFDMAMEVQDVGFVEQFVQLLCELQNQNNVLKKVCSFDEVMQVVFEKHKANNRILECLMCLASGTGLNEKLVMSIVSHLLERILYFNETLSQFCNHIFEGFLHYLQRKKLQNNKLVIQLAAQLSFNPIVSKKEQGLRLLGSMLSQSDFEMLEIYYQIPNLELKLIILLRNPRREIRSLSAFALSNLFAFSESYLNMFFSNESVEQFFQQSENLVEEELSYCFRNLVVQSNVVQLKELYDLGVMDRLSEMLLSDNPTIEQVALTAIVGLLDRTDFEGIREFFRVRDFAEILVRCDLVCDIEHVFKKDRSKEIEELAACILNRL